MDGSWISRLRPRIQRVKRRAHGARRSTGGSGAWGGVRVEERDVGCGMLPRLGGSSLLSAGTMAPFDWCEAGYKQPMLRLGWSRCHDERGAKMGAIPGERGISLLDSKLAASGRHPRQSPELASPRRGRRFVPMSRTRLRMTLVGLASLLFVFAGCSGKSATAKTEATNAVAKAPEVQIPFKIGIMTGTVSQGEDEFRAGQMVVAKYGADHVKMVTYPDNFMNEQETVISQLVGLASDPDVKVIIVGQAIPGSIAALRKIKEKRPDIKMAFIEAHEDPSMVNDAVSY